MLDLMFLYIQTLAPGRTYWRRTKILLGPGSCLAQFMGSLLRPIRIAQGFAAEQNHVGLTAADDVISLGGRCNQSPVSTFR